MYKPQLLHFDFQNDSLPQWPKQMYNAYLNDDRMVSKIYVKPCVNQNDSPPPPRNMCRFFDQFPFWCHIFQIRKQWWSKYPSLDAGVLAPTPGYPRFRLCPSVWGLLCILLVIHIAGKLIRCREQAQRYVDEETLYFSHWEPTCYHLYSIVHVLLAEDLKQCCTSWAVTLCDNFTRSFSFQTSEQKYG